MAATFIWGDALGSNGMTEEREQSDTEQAFTAVEDDSNFL